MKKALIVIDHGSRLQAANDMIFDVVEKLRQAAPDLIIEGCHMELADPDIEAAFTACVQRGATHITAQPFMLSPGRHSTKDIPELVQQAAAKFPEINYHVASHFGLHPSITDLILDNSQL